MAERAERAERAELGEAMTATIREASDADLPAILAIYNAAVLQTTASFDEQPATLAARTAWYEERRQKGLPVLVVELEGTVVGWGSFGQFRDKPAYRYSVEHSLYVVAEQQGRGLGRLLLRELIERARKHGAHTMIGVIEAENRASIALHAAQGFVQAAYLHEVGYKFGRWLDLVLMELLLDKG